LTTNLGITEVDIANFKPTPTQDLVGFLPLSENLHFAGGRFEPAPNFPEALASVAEITNADHFVYPPTVYTAKGRSFNEDANTWTEVPKTRRPALLHRLPPSHFLHLDQQPANGDLRSADGAFLIHAVGYVFGHRMQFYNWWFDGRVQMKSAHHAYVSPGKASLFLATAYSSWRGWKPPAQNRFTNALYMLCRGPSYEWEWEQFTIYYMVFDALYKTANELHGVSADKHPERLAAMSQRYGLFQDKTLFSRITKLRGDLFHEALWAGGQPGSSPADDSWSQVGNLRRICERLVPAIVGFKTDYVATPWNSIGATVF
jgi:hypothetical protein